MCALGYARIVVLCGCAYTALARACYLKDTPNHKCAHAQRSPMHGAAPIGRRSSHLVHAGPPIKYIYKPQAHAGKHTRAHCAPRRTRAHAHDTH